MKRSSLILLGAALDCLAGDPEWLPHPVRGIGWCIDRGEQRFYDETRGNKYQLLAGMSLASGVAIGTYATSAAFLYAMRRLDRRAAAITEIVLASMCLASRNLYDEASSVLHELDAGQLEKARVEIARIVGRDTDELDAPEISRALIETLAESASDGIVAPMFYLALGGVPLALCYKAINTMDSMIGHADPHYFWFGKAAARLDDVVNLLPSRLTAAMIATVSVTNDRQAPARSAQVWLRDGMKHKSPNAGQPESAMAGALAVRLGGRNHYDGVLIESHVIGREFQTATPADARKALRLVATVSVVAAVMAAFLVRRKT